jgi:hypothetical protein
MIILDFGSYNFLGRTSKEEHQKLHNLRINRLEHTRQFIELGKSKC